MKEKRHLIECVNAHLALSALMDKELDYQTAYAVLGLRRALSEHVAFFKEAERALLEKYAARGEDGEILWEGEGKFVFREPSKCEEFRKQHKELGMVEVSGIQPFYGRRPKEIRPAVLLALEGFLIFEEDAI